jgi:hypothetical protein
MYGFDVGVVTMAVIMAVALGMQSREHDKRDEAMRQFSKEYAKRTLEMYMDGEDDDES